MVDLPSFPVFFLIFFLLFDSSFEQYQVLPLNSHTERVSLLQLRSSLGLRSKQWPLKSDPCLSWVGIECKNGSVIGIDISKFRRTRVGRQNPQFSVDSLANFSSLVSFNATRFPLPGSIPDWFGHRLVALHVLDLRRCSIVGNIPSSIGNLIHLSVLYLSGNGLTGLVPPSLGQLLNLTVLDLSCNSLVGSIPSSFGALMNLSLLDLSVNNLSGAIPPGIGSLAKLEVLNLSRNSIFSSIPAQLSDLSSLIDLDLSFNSFYGPLAPDLRVLRSLQKMVIRNNQLTGSLPVNLFTELTKLQVIVLTHNNFNSELPAILWSMASLHLLDASANKFTGVLPNLSSGAIAGLTVLNLSQNLFYGGLTSVIRRFDIIDLSNNYFQGTVPEHSRSNASLSRNCLRGESSQRSVASCASFYAERGLAFDKFGLSVNQTPAKSHQKSHRKTIILAGVLGGLGFIALLVILLILLILCTRKRQITSQTATGVAHLATDAKAPNPRGSLELSSLGEEFTYQQILQATNEFSDINLIKIGHSGELFRGVLEGGMRVVIKRIDLSFVKKDAYMLELDVFSKVSHPRFVPLLGHCLENENEKFLIYKYMLNGDLSSSLYRKKDSEDDKLLSLDWITRLKIATGVAEGLSYLHHECAPPLVHRNVQASSILLDDKYDVRLGSLSEVCVQEGDAHQSRFTRLLRLSQTSEQGASDTPTTNCAFDVYCFGKVLLELVTGKMGMSASSEGAVKEWLEVTLPFISIYDMELLTNVVDPSLIIDEDLLEEVWAMAIVARSCLNPKPARRPLVKYILKALENPLKVVREGSNSSRRLQSTSSTGAWGVGIFGSWRTSSDVASVPATAPISKAEGASSHKRSRTSGSQGSGENTNGDHWSSNRCHQSRDIFPEPLEEEDIMRLHED